MERKLSDGLIWRTKPTGGYYPHIYFKKMYRGHYLRGSSKTSDPAEAERRLRKLLSDIDNQELYGVRPKRTFSEGARKLIQEFQGRPKTLLMYARQADLLEPWVGVCELPVTKDDLRPFIESRKSQGLSIRTINISIELVRMVNRKARFYWMENKLSWTNDCPVVSFEKGPKKKPYTLSWEEQEVFFDLLPGIKRKVALVAVNTGLRDNALVNLRWTWEQRSETLKESIFEVPGEFTKNGKPMVLILNRVARREVESLRGRHSELVFGEIGKITDKAWYRAWKQAGLPVGDEWLKGVHNLRHTFGKRLRDAGVDERDVQDLLHHMPKTVTRHYSEPELRKLKECVELIVPKHKLVEAA